MDRTEVRIKPTPKELFGDLAFEDGVSISKYFRTLIIKGLERKTNRWRHEKPKIS